MNDAEVAMIKEALDLLDKAVTMLNNIENNTTAHVIAKVVHGAISIGEMML